MNNKGTIIELDRNKAFKSDDKDFENYSSFRVSFSLSILTVILILGLSLVVAYTTIQLYTIYTNYFVNNRRQDRGKSRLHF